MKDLHQLSVSEAAAAIAEGRLRSVDLVEACLARIQAREPDIQAWVQFDAERALAHAARCDAAAAKGPLHGVPVGVKDVYDTQDFPTSYGSPLYQGYQPQQDANSVRLIERAGGIVLGKTVTTEFALYQPNKTRNPHNLGRTPGGSSSGSAAAVADGHVPLALGTQTSGSIIRPAAFCGVVGYKPTLSLFATTGVKPLAGSLDTVGGFTRSVEDLRILWDVLHANEAPTAITPNTRPRIAYCETPYWSAAAPEQQRAMRDAADQLSQAGFHVEEVKLPAWFDALNDAHTDLLGYEVARQYVHEYSPENRQTLGPATLKVIEDGWKVSTSAYLSARSLRRRAAVAFAAASQGYDVFMVPAAPGAAPDIAATGDPVFNRMWTMLGVPAISLPVPGGADNMPLGLQFVAGPDCDLQLIAACQAIETILKGSKQPARDADFVVE